MLILVCVPCRLHPANFIMPIFVHEDSSSNVPIASMPGIERLSFGKNVLDHVAEARSVGINQVVIFPKTPQHLKTSTAEEAFNKNGLSQRTIRSLKDKFPDLEVSCNSLFSKEHTRVRAASWPVPTAPLALYRGKLVRILCSLPAHPSVTCAAHTDLH